MQEVTISQQKFFLPNVFFAVSLFPFVSPYPIQTDTQPPTLIIAGLIIMLDFFRDIKFSRSEVVLLLCGVLQLLYLNPAGDFLFPTEMGKYLSFLAGSMIFVVAKRYYHVFSPKVFFYSVIVYFVATILFLIEPSKMYALQEQIVRGINVDIDASDLFVYRGVPTFSTEAGFFGGLLVYFFILLEYFNKKNCFTLFQKNAIVLMLIFMILETKSGTGYIYFSIYVLYLSIKYLRKKSLILTVGFIALTGYLIMYLGASLASSLGLGRGLNVMLNIIQNPSDIWFDTSILKRAYDFIIGFSSLYLFPFGVGANNISVAIVELKRNFDYINSFYGMNDVGLVSGTTWLFMSDGIFALLYIIYIYFNLSKASWHARFFAFTFMAISFSPSFPGIWLLLAQPKLTSSSQRSLQRSESPIGDIIDDKG